MVQSKRRGLNMPELESVNRIYNLPIVETGLNYAENIYQRIKVRAWQNPIQCLITNEHLSVTIKNILKKRLFSESKQPLYLDI